jgi:hypothetical protein
MQENARHQEYPIPQAIWNAGKTLDFSNEKRPDQSGPSFGKSGQWRLFKIGRRIFFNYLIKLG